MDTVANDHFLFRLWRGEYSLARTYWGFGALVSVCWQLALWLMALDPAGWLFMGLHVVMAVYFCVVYVGIWRAAGRYRGSRIWAWLARLAVALSALLSLLMLGDMLTWALSTPASRVLQGI